MNTKFKNFRVEPAFEELFSFSGKAEKIEHRAQMISFRILSEVQRICDEKEIKMKDLAELVDTSASYITQLFRGNKQVNTAFMARFEEAINMIFEIGLQHEKEQHDDLSRNHVSVAAIRKSKEINPAYAYYAAIKGGKEDKTGELVQKMAEKNVGRDKVKQIA